MENRTYGIFYSTDMSDWSADVTDSVPSEGDSTSFGPFDNPLPGVPRLFFRVQETDS